MFTISLFIIHISVTMLGIYLYDYRIDGIINSPLVIVLSIVVGLLVVLLYILAYVEIFYILVAKNKPINSKLKHRVANQLMAMPLYFTNTRIKVEGMENLPNDPGFSIYSNHTSMMDIPVFMVGLNKYPIAFLAKEVVGKLFGVGKWAISLGGIMIDRSNDRKGAEAIINVIRNVKNGSTMVIFPEGTRTKEIGSLREFKTGSFKVALKSKAPLVPITIVKPQNFNEIKWPLKKNIKIVVHKPIPFEEIKGVNSLDLSNRVRKIISKPLEMNQFKI